MKEIKHNYKLVDVKVFSAQEFIELTQSEPRMWINYCEVVLLNNGDVVLARPSHQECLIKIAADIERVQVSDIRQFLRDNYLGAEYYLGKYQLVSLWYDYVRSGQRLTNEQLDTMKQLKAAGLINIRSCDVDLEYTNFLVRQEMNLT